MSSIQFTSNEKGGLVLTGDGHASIRLRGKDGEAGVLIYVDGGVAVIDSPTPIILRVNGRDVVIQ